MNYSKDLIETIAQMTHEVNRAWCIYNNDFSQVHWEDAPDWQINSAYNGIMYKLENPNATPKDMHDNWMSVKLSEGWVYGETKDVEKKTHTCLVAYEELPEYQKIKDYLFSTIVEVFINFKINKT